MPQKLTNEIITAAIAGFEAQKTHIDSQIAELRAMLTGQPAKKTAAPEGPAPKRKVSAAARRKMALAQKRRWEKVKEQTEVAQAPAKKVAALKNSAPKKVLAKAPVRKKRTFTAAQRKAFGERMRKYWAAKRKGAKA